MFIGHFALGLAAKRAAPRLSLGVLFAAAQLADILWPALLALGLEQVRLDPGNTAFTPLDFVSYPYSHSLLMLLVWGALMGVMFSRNNRRLSILLALLVVSHWVLDFVTHRPDMPLYPGSPRVGLGLWNSPAATVVIEVAMYFAGVWIYMRATRARDGIGRWAFIALAATLLLIYAADAISDAPPPSVGAIILIGILGGPLFIAWSWWADRHRIPDSGPRV